MGQSLVCAWAFCTEIAEIDEIAEFAVSPTPSGWDVALRGVAVEMDIITHPAARQSGRYFTISVRRLASRSGGIRLETNPSKRPAGSMMWMTEVWSMLYSPLLSSCRRA
jgi:hypothetical protein